MDRRALTEPAVAIVAGAFGIWLARVGPTGNLVPDPWTIWLLPVVLFGATLFVIAKWKPRGRGKGADFVLTWRSPQMWEIERIRPIPAFEVRYGDGIISSSNLSGVAQMPLGDFAHNERRFINTPNSDGCLVPFVWREGTEHYVSKSVFLVDRGDPIEIVGMRVDPTRPVVT